MSHRIIFMGTPAFAVPILESLHEASFDVALVVSQPDRPQGRKRELIPTPVAAKAKELDLPLFQPEKVRDQAFFDCLASARADFIVTAAYGRILSPEVLGLPRLAAVNVHASLLPKYRGASPVQWSIINGDDITGISIMLMDNEMDHGAVLEQHELDIPEYITADLLMERLSELGAETIGPVLIAFSEGRVRPEEQDHSKASYVKPLRRQDGLMDWTKSGFNLHNLVRGTYPWPGAYTFLNGKRFKVHRTKVEDYPEETLAAYGAVRGTDAAVQPGTVVYAQQDRLLVACGSGVLSLLEVQPEGARRMQAAEISHNIPIGTRFGQEEDKD